MVNEAKEQEEWDSLWKQDKKVDFTINPKPIEEDSIIKNGEIDLDAYLLGDQDNFRLK